jgi:N6-adenosine-specific RNA methylase IME4
MNDKKYSLIYADPPWKYQNYGYSHTKTGSRAKRGVEKEYGTMNNVDICNLPISDIAADDCLLAMWWVPPMPQEALDVVKAWGFTLKTMKGFTWHKTTTNGLSFFGMGNWTRCNTEDCLFAVRGKPRRMDASVRQFLEHPRGKHSEKPSEARDRLVKMMGDIPRVELFARDTTPGWDVFGNQVEGSIQLPNLITP